MNKNVLIISSSPRKGGNSDVLCDEFLRGSQESGNDVKKIFLKDKKINYCTGCGYCNKNAQTGCSQKDDMNEILDAIIDADVIVLSTPVYFYTMCAQLKTLIDRCCAKYTKITNKEFYFIMTAADSSKESFDRVLEEFRGFLYCLESPQEKGSVLASGVWQIGEVQSTEFATQAYETGKNV